MPVPVAPTVDADFFADYADVVGALLDASPFQNGRDADSHATVRRFCDMVRRRIPEQPRTVVRAEPFSFPADRDQADLEARLGRPLAKVEAGDDLNPHLSLQSVDLLQQDALFNDWGIRHFHLSFNRRHDGFVQRSGPLLYARVTPERLYAIGVFEHGTRQNHQFEDRGLLRIEHENWPEVIALWRLPEGLTPLYDYGDELRRGLREAGITTNVQLDDDVTFTTPGGGYTSTGEPTGCAIEANAANNALALARLRYQDSASVLVAAAERSGLTLGLPIRLDLWLDGTMAYAVERESQAAFPMFDLAGQAGFESYVAYLSSQ